MSIESQPTMQPSSLTPTRSFTWNGETPSAQNGEDEDGSYTWDGSHPLCRSFTWNGSCTGAVEG